MGGSLKNENQKTKKCIKRDKKQYITYNNRIIRIRMDVLYSDSDFHF